MSLHDPVVRIAELHHRAAELVGMGRYEAALAAAEYALALAEAGLGDDHPATAGCLLQLGAVSERQGDLVAAWSYHERVLAIACRVLGDDHELARSCCRHLGTLLPSLAATRRARGDLAGARACLVRALELTRADGPDQILVLSNLGAVLRDAGDLAGARRYLERAVAACDRQPIADRYGMATARAGLGHVLVDQHELGAARPHLECAFAIYRELLGAAHPATVQAARALAAVDELIAARADHG